MRRVGKQGIAGEACQWATEERRKVLLSGARCEGSLIEINLSLFPTDAIPARDTCHSAIREAYHIGKPVGRLDHDPNGLGRTSSYLPGPNHEFYVEIY